VNREARDEGYKIKQAVGFGKAWDFGMDRRWGFILFYWDDLRPHGWEVS